MGRKSHTWAPLSKCVLDLNFAPIKRSVFLIFLKKVIFVVPQCAVQLQEKNV
jgi:hypothetical protein